MPPEQDGSSRAGVALGGILGSARYETDGQDSSEVAEEWEMIRCGNHFRETEKLVL